jgi:hypothetical protein
MSLDVGKLGILTMRGLTKTRTKGENFEKFKNEVASPMSMRRLEIIQTVRPLNTRFYSDWTLDHLL